MCFTTVTSIDELNDLIAGSPEQRLHIEHNAYGDPTPALITQAIANKSQKNTLVICADHGAMFRYRYLADKQSGEIGCGPRVLTVQDFCIELLTTLDAEQLFGRKPRVLSENEYDILVEDMKVSGLKAHRIREILKFFQKSISENAHLQEGFLLSAEERLLYKMLQENLLARRAMLAAELPALALQAFKQNPNALGEDLSIIASDYGTYSLAAQQLIESVAQNRLVVCGTTELCCNAEEPYPHLQGFVDFAARHPRTKSIKLETPLPDVAKETCAYACADDEIADVAKKVAALINDGTAPGKIAIAVPNNGWGERIGKLLADEGIDHTQIEASTKIKGDIRNADKCGHIKLDAFMRLLKDGNDLVALRTWIAAGDWLAASDAFAELMAYAADNDVPVELAIRDLRARHSGAQATGSRALKLFGKIEKALDELDELIEQLPQMGCAEAAKKLADHGMRLSPQMIECIKSNPLITNMAELCEHVLARTNLLIADAVLIAPYSHCHGTCRALSFITGLVGGFLPGIDALSDDYSAEHQKTMLARGQHLFNDLQNMATEELTLSYFAGESLELATKQKLNTTRIYIKNGQRRARVAACPYLEQIADKQLQA